jgi:GNAT superfamily N-acetyltransferase
MTGKVNQCLSRGRNGEIMTPVQTTGQAATRTTTQATTQDATQDATPIQTTTRQTPCARPIEPQEVTTCGILLGLCFEDEGWSAALVEGLDDPASRRRFLRDVSIDDLRAYADHKSVLVIDAWDTSAWDAARDTSARDTSQDAARDTSQADSPQTNSSQTNSSQIASPPTVDVDPAFDDLPAGTVLFDIASISTPAEHAASWERSMQRGCSTLSATEVRLIKERAHLLEGMESGSWCAQAFPDGYGYIAAVCVNPHYRGLGVLSALLDPIATRAEELHTPLCLETYAERSMSIYKHKGFEIVDVITNKELPLTQYCMVKRPKKARTIV